MNFELLALPSYLLEHQQVVWTFILLMTRFGAVISFIPGLGMGLAGVAIRFPAVIVLSAASMSSSQLAGIPSDMISLILQLVSEILFGLALSLIPLIMVAGVQTAGGLASTTMGLQPSQLIDPTSQLPLSDISRIYADLTIILFMMMGGHHVIIHAAAGLGGTIVPGTFIVGQNTIDLLIDRSATIFEIGVMIASPVIVALLLANFVMGLISKAIPTVNIFIISFPITIGIGLVLSALLLPELVELMSQQILGIEGSVHQLSRDLKLIGVPI